MKYRVFNYPLPCEEELKDLNGFLSSHRILKVLEEVVQSGNNAMLVFVVNYLDAPFESTSRRGDPKIDYKKELSQEDFAVFSRLRDARKELAEKEGIPLYSVFTNAQLAEMVTKKVKTKADLERVPGVGAARSEKYAETILKVCGDFFDSHGHSQ